MKISVVTFGRGSSSDLILKFAATTTLSNYYPRIGEHNSTGKSYAASTQLVPGVLIPITTQEITINIPAASSQDKTRGIFDVYYLPGI